MAARHVTAAELGARRLRIIKEMALDGRSVTITNRGSGPQLTGREIQVERVAFRNLSA